MREKPSLFGETKKIAIAIVSDPWEIIETRPLGYPRNVYSYPRIVYMTVATHLKNYFRKFQKFYSAQYQC